MINELDTSNTCISVYRPTIVSQSGISEAVRDAQQAGALVIEVWIPAQSQEYRAMMERLGFSIGGSASVDLNIYIKYRRTLASAGDGQLHNPDLATAPVRLPPSDQERAAISLLEARFSPEAIDARVRALQGKAS